MITKLCRVVTNDERNSPIMSHGSLTTKLREVTWQMKNEISSLAQHLWPEWWFMMRETHPWSHIFLWPPGHMRSRDKLKTKYFFLQKTYRQQTLQGADIWWGEGHNEVVQLWSRDHKRSPVNLKTQCPLLQGLYHQSWQGGDVWWKKDTHGVTWLFDNAVLWGHMKNLKHSISFSARPMAPNFGKWRDSTHSDYWIKWLHGTKTQNWKLQ